jgi:hypothetical protein
MSRAEPDPFHGARKPALQSDCLMDLYKIAVDEYRFEVKLNWDRTAFYLTLDSGLLAVAAGLLKLQAGDSHQLLNLSVAFVFLAGAMLSIIGVLAVRRGHDYYRRTVIKKTIIEDALGLTRPITEYPLRHSLAISTTLGQGEHLQIIYNTSDWQERAMRPGSVTSLTIATLVMFLIVDAVGFVGSVSLYAHPGTPSAPAHDLERPRVIPITRRGDLDKRNDLAYNALRFSTVGVDCAVARRTKL